MCPYLSIVYFTKFEYIMQQFWGKCKQKKRERAKQLRNSRWIECYFGLFNCGEWDKNWLIGLRKIANDDCTNKQQECLEICKDRDWIFVGNVLQTLAINVWNFAMKCKKTSDRLSF